MPIPSPVSVREKISPPGQLLARITEMMETDISNGGKLKDGQSVGLHPCGLVRWQIGLGGASPEEIQQVSDLLLAGGWLCEERQINSGRRDLLITENKPEVMSAWVKAREDITAQQAVITAKLNELAAAQRTLAKEVEGWRKAADALSKTLADI